MDNNLSAFMHIQSWFDCLLVLRLHLQCDLDSTAVRLLVKKSLS